MNISKPFILKPVFTTLVMVTLACFGILAYKHLPVSAFPEMQYPTIEITVSYPGASPDQMADLIASPLEKQLILMQGIEYIFSTNTYESTQIICQFHLGVDIDVGAQEVDQAIEKTSGLLPADLPQNPVYEKYNPADTPVLYFVTSSPVISESDLYDYGYNFLAEQISTVQGVGNIDTYGFAYAVRVKVDPQALAAKNISLNDVADAIKGANTLQPTGKFYGSKMSMPILVDGQIVKAEDYKSIIVKIVDGEPVRLQDIATVKSGLENDKEAIYWVTKDHPEGMKASYMAVYRQPGFNTVQVCDKIEALLKKLMTQIPRGIRVEIPFILSKWIREAIAEVEFTLLIAFLLVVLVVFFYLGRFRNSLIPLVTLPITVLGTFIIMWVIGYNLDIMSLSAITLGIGFLVDDAIVVLENIVRWGQEKKFTSFEAAMHGSQQIILAVVSISLCICAVFLPMLFMSGAVGQLFHEFAAVIIIAVLFSAFISLSLTPMLASRFVREFEASKMTRMEKFSFWFNEKLLSVYKPLLSFFIAHRLFLVIGAIGLFVISIFLFRTMPQEFLPEDDLGVIEIFVTAPEGTSPEAMQEFLNQIRDIGNQNPYVLTSAIVRSTPTDNQGVGYFNLVERKDRPSIEVIMKDISEKISKIVGLRVFLKSFPLINLQLGGSTSGKAKFQYLVQSYDTEQLYTSVGTLVEKMRKSKFFTDVSTDVQPYSPALFVDLLRDPAYSYGNLDATTIENAFKYAYGETYISKINVPQDTYYVILETEPSFYRDPGKLGTLYTSNTESGQVAINSTIDKTVKSAPSIVSHLNTLPAMTVMFNPASGVALNEAISELDRLAKETLPADVMTQMVGNTAAFQSAMKEFALLVILSIFVVYIILGILYENFLHPITALSVLPIAMFGGLVSLLIFGQNLSIYALVGLIMLLGIVMKNGILIIDFTLEIMEQEKVSAEKGVFKACILRFRPIVMTTIAAMMGSVPVALGIGGTVAKGRAPLGIAVVGGLIFAQIVSLFLTPVIFIYMDRFNSYLKRRYALFRTYEEGGPPKRRVRKKVVKEKG